MNWYLKIIGFLGVGALVVIALVVITLIFPFWIGLVVNFLVATGCAYGAGHVGYLAWREGQKSEAYDVFFLAPIAGICFCLSLGMIAAFGVRVW